MDISIIGAGNLAWHLAMALEKAGFAVKEIYSRDIRDAVELSDSLYAAVAVNSLDFSRSSSSLFILCVSDDAIINLASQLTLPNNSILVHTSGAKPISALQSPHFKYNNLEINFGVLYPLYTFSKGKRIEFSEVPICVEATNSSTQKVLLSVAHKLSRTVEEVSSADRLVYHVGAVFSANFANHLWALSKEILESESLDFEMLKPLIIETTQKMLDAGHPADVQTGPAVRNDVGTINKHLEVLQDDEDLVSVYTTLTESISDWHRED